MITSRLTTRLVRFLCSGRIRGGDRLISMLAMRSSSLQNMVSSVPGGTLSLDLRNAGARTALVQSAAGLSVEQKILARVIRPGDIAFDIGANVGYLTVWISYLVGQTGSVHAFEPNPTHLNSLRRSISFLENARLWDIGLSDQPEVAEFFVPGDDTMASLRDWTGNEHGLVKKIECSFETIDSLTSQGQLPYPDLIKCDIEGAELQCFKGGKETIDRNNGPIILFEANINSAKGFGVQISAAMDFLASLKNADYSFYRLYDDGKFEAMQHIDFLHGNILAVPANRMGRLEYRDDS